MLTKGSHACRGLSFFTIRREQLGAKVNAMGHPTSISCQQQLQLLHSSEVTVGCCQLSDNVQIVFRICLREMEMKWGGQHAFKGEVFRATKRTEAHHCHWECPFPPWYISSLCSHCLLSDSVRWVKTKHWPREILSTWRLPSPWQQLSCHLWCFLLSTFDQAPDVILLTRWLWIAPPYVMTSKGAAIQNGERHEEETHWHTVTVIQSERWVTLIIRMRGNALKLH